MAVQLLDKTLVMTQRRSHLVKSVSVDDAVETTVSNIYGEPKADRFDEIIDLLKSGNIYGEKDSVWVSNTYNGGVPTDLQSESGLVGYWRFEEGKGTIVKDLSGEGNHGTFGAISGNTTALPTWSSDTPLI